MKLIFAALLLPSFAFANDGIGAVSTGGIVFRKTDAIAMKKEVLNVSHDLISVDYEFVNESPRDVEETIIFPLPEYPVAIQMGNTYYGQPSGFSIYVDGRPVGFITRVQATLDERDVTTQLKKAGLSDAQIAFSAAFKDGAKVPELSARQRQQLMELGLIGELADGEIGSRWSVRVNYIWRQKFPARKVLRVHHEYRPFVSAGTGASTTADDFAQRYCADQAFFKAHEKIAARTEGGFPNARAVSYILKTGNTWKRGIEDFTLNIVKRSPVELVSLCFPGDFKRIDAQTLQVRLKNFRPADDLAIYFANVEHSEEDGSGVMPAAAK
ncbi:DUF4424 family protein [Massilia sp. erpn]|uniref:DUF4424 family protein n=1 Tax=Massilia sp. erpn TaxID=2738142 RepID=UPI0021078F1D|nr:DUF4424 family protein [Massilia sp. erpn]UTY57214.1 DUF4424 family protein [Massilia sp. erpn]